MAIYIKFLTSQFLLCHVRGTHLSWIAYPLLIIVSPMIRKDEPLETPEITNGRRCVRRISRALTEDKNFDS